MRNYNFKFRNWLERRWVAPAYGGGLLLALSIFLFGAATNTMAGWLYVISGICFALLGIAIILPQRSLVALQVRRGTLDPVSVGEQLTLELEIENTANSAKTLIQVQDLLPSSLGKSTTVIEILPPHRPYKWITYLTTEKRGIYHWQTVKLRTATPLGLFWCSRERQVPATAIIYPFILPLKTCPIVDETGREYNPKVYERNRFKMATEGVTRNLKPYRYGDPTRLIHWRSSARYGEFRVRELEISSGGQEVIICLDSASIWQPDDFEQAVTAAASLYFYACRSQINVQLWTAKTGLVYGNRLVLYTLADVNFGQELSTEPPPNLSLIWLTQNPETLNTLPDGSRWLLWPNQVSLKSQFDPGMPRERLSNLGLEIRPEQPLQMQLQSSLR